MKFAGIFEKKENKKKKEEEKEKRGKERNKEMFASIDDNTKKLSSLLFFDTSGCDISGNIRDNDSVEINMQKILVCQTGRLVRIK